jgi:hypothetical protein
MAFANAGVECGGQRSGFQIAKDDTAGDSLQIRAMLPLHEEAGKRIVSAGRINLNDPSNLKHAAQ